MAVNEEMAQVVARVAGESQDRFDVIRLRQERPGRWFDGVVKPQRRPGMRLKGQERLRIGPFRVEDRENVGDPAGIVIVEFVESADGEGMEGGELHARSP